MLSRGANANYNSINVDPSGRVRARLPFNGHIMLQQALSSGADVLTKSLSGGGACKAWVLRGRRDGALRIVLINKVSGPLAKAARSIFLTACNESVLCAVQASVACAPSLCAHILFFLCA